MKETIIYHILTHLGYEVEVETIYENSPTITLGLL